MKTSDKIIKYITENHQTAASELVTLLGITDRAVRKQLKKLLEDGRLVKAGVPPRVFYSVSTGTNTENNDYVNNDPEVDKSVIKIIDDNFLYVTAFGKKFVGWAGFTMWCRDRNLDILKMAPIYHETIGKYDTYRKDGLIDGMYKMKHTFPKVALDKVFYVDFYNIEIFGKTKLGQLLLFSKQSQDRAMMNQMIDGVAPFIHKVMDTYDIDGVVFVPPTVKREFQLMRQLRKRLSLNVRVLNVAKIKTQVVVPQKTLSKLADRITNAKETIVLEDTNHYRNVLILDDAIGSGATLNEIAKKIRQRGICQGKIIGLAITGSPNGFDVISEV